MPIDEEPSSLKSGNDPHNNQCWNTGRILDKVEIWFRCFDEEEIEKLKDLQFTLEKITT